jgi:hypothetical protein
LEQGDPAATIDRLLVSQHVKDLRFIVAGTFLAVCVVFIAGLPISFEYQVATNWEEIAASHSYWWIPRLGLTALATLLTVLGPVLAALGVVVAWAYQVGSARLGVVDLFASEISTVCRVITIVGTVDRYIEWFGKNLPSQEAIASESQPTEHHPFTSKENYFPVFENNARDLQSLEARVVINITAFYTYMKVFRDSRRALAGIGAQPNDFRGSPADQASTRGYEALRNLIYMLFLALESARHAIADLIEFEPEQAECTIVVLISELKAYDFLRHQFLNDKDIRHQRITLRDDAYRKVVPKLVYEVKAGRDSDKSIEAGMQSRPPRWTPRWEPAWRLIAELERLYESAIAPIKS